MVGNPCDFSVSPSPFCLDFGTSDSGLTIYRQSKLLLYHVGLPHVLDLAVYLVIFWPGWAYGIILRQFYS